MKRIRVADMSALRVQTVEKVCTFTCRNDRGEQLEIRMPSPVVEQAAAQILRARLSLDVRQLAGSLQKRGDLEELPVLDPRSVNVGLEPMQDPPAVLLILDRGTETQLAYRLHPEQAQSLAQQLADQIAESSRLARGPRN